MTLQCNLDAFRASWEHRLGTGTCSIVEKDIEAATANISAAHTACPGEKFPLDDRLRDAHNKPFDLKSYATGKSVVIKIYRGGWCPFCRIDLRAYEAFLPAIIAKGAAFVAISPELPHYVAKTIEENDLTFPALSDVGGVMIKKLGLQWPVPGEIESHLQKAGINLKLIYGTTVPCVSIPATYVLSPDGRVAEAFLTGDFRKREEPEQILQWL